MLGAHRMHRMSDLNQAMHVHGVWIHVHVIGQEYGLLHF